MTPGAFAVTIVTFCERRGWGMFMPETADAIGVEGVNPGTLNGMMLT